MWDRLISVCVCLCDCDSEALYRRKGCLSLACEQKPKTKTSFEENDNDSEASGTLHESAQSHESPGFITLHTGVSTPREVHLMKPILCLTRRITDCQIKLTAGRKLSLLMFPFPIAPYRVFFFFNVTSVFAQCCATGGLPRVCFVVCCYASPSGMHIHSSFFFSFKSGSLTSPQKRANNPVPAVDSAA